MLKKLLFVGAFLTFFAVLAINYKPIRSYFQYLYGQSRGGYTVSERLAQYSQAVEQRVKSDFDAANVAYPPNELAYVAFKDSNLLEVYARSSDTQAWKFVKTYPILGASGVLGPKLAQGDQQVPEGIYRSEFLNANSRFHLSIRVNYPNAFDQKMAKADGRTKLGGDIMIHGSNVSVGCLAMGDTAAEDLFVLTALTQSGSVHIVISPTDFRVQPLINLNNLDSDPNWVRILYKKIHNELKNFNKPLQKQI